MQKKKSILLIGPPPYKDGGSWISFDLLYQSMRKIPHLMIHKLDLPVHHPFYIGNRAIGPVSHPRTVFRLLHAVKMVHSVDNVIIFGAPDVCFSYGLILILYSKIIRKRCVVRFTGGRGIITTKFLPVFARSICLFIARAVDMILTQTELARNELPASLRSRTIVVKGFRPRSAPGQTLTCRTKEGIDFVFIGNLGYVKSNKMQFAGEGKGLDVLLDAIDHVICSAKFPRDLIKDIRFHIYGKISTNMYERIQRMPNVTAHGVKDNSLLRYEIKQYDILVFPSRYVSEGHPGSIIEGFMTGLPVIASDLPGPSEIVHHEVNGLIVKTGDVDDLATSIIRLATDRALRRRLASGARASATEFDQDRVLPVLINFLLSETPG